MRNTARSTSQWKPRSRRAGLSAALQPERRQELVGDQARAEDVVDGLGVAAPDGVLASGEHGRLFGELGAVGEQALEGAGVGEAVVAAEVGDDALADLVSDAEGLDDLEVGVLAVGFEAEEHGLY